MTGSQAEGSPAGSQGPRRSVAPFVAYSSVGGAVKRRQQKGVGSAVGSGPPQREAEESTKAKIRREFVATDPLVPLNTDETEQTKRIQVHEVALGSLGPLQSLAMELDLNFQSVQAATQQMRSQELGLSATEGRGSHGDSSGMVDWLSRNFFVQFHMPPQVGPSSKRRPGVYPCEVTASLPCHAMLMGNGDGTRRSRERANGLHSLPQDLRTGDSLCLFFSFGTGPGAGQAVQGGLTRTLSSASLRSSGEGIGGRTITPDDIPASVERTLDDHLADQLRKQGSSQAGSPRRAGESSRAGSQAGTPSARSVGSRAAAPTPSSRPASRQERARKAELEKVFVEEARTYLRDVRLALRHLASTAPRAARVLEGSLKGFVLALDKMMLELQSKNDSLEQQLAARESQLAAQEKNEEDLLLLRGRYKALAEELARKEEHFAKVDRERSDRVKDLMAEIRSLTPHADDLTGITATMDQLHNVMTEFEEETGKSLKNLNEIQRSTLNLIARNKEEFDSWGRARVVESDHEVLLRPYCVSDAEIQITEQEHGTLQLSDALLHPPRCRRAFAQFSGRGIDSMTVSQLEGEIDRIFDAKYKADQHAQQNPEEDVAPAALLDFVVDYYLDLVQYASLAEAQLYKMLACINEDSLLPTYKQSPKVALFARFLGFCPLKQVLHHDVLGMVLHFRHSMSSNPNLQKPEDGSTTTLPLKDALDVAGAAINPSGPLRDGPASSAIFAALVSHAEFTAGAAAAPKATESLRMWNGILAVMFEKLKSGQCKKLEGDLLQRGDHSRVGVSEWRDAMAEAGVVVEDESGWREFLEVEEVDDTLDPAALKALFTIDGEASTIQVAVTDGAILEAAADGFAAEEIACLAPLCTIWDSHIQQDPNGKKAHNLWSCSDIGDALREFNPDLTETEIKKVYEGCIDLTTSCCQRTGIAAGQPWGTLEPQEDNRTQVKQYGGDAISLDILLRAYLNVHGAGEHKAARPGSASEIRDTSRRTRNQSM